MNTALYLRRALEAGLALRDLELLSVGMVFDILTEAGNDINGEYAELATDEDVDRL